MSPPQPKIDKGTGIREKLLSFFNLLRGSDWWFYKIPPLLAIAYAEILLQATPPQQSIATLLTLLASMFFVAAYGHVINDIFDVEVDLQAGKQNRMASLSNSQRILLCTSLAVVGLVPWLFTGFSTQSAILLASIYTLLTIYAAPPLRLKEKDIWGVITDAAAVHTVPTLFVATVFSQLASPPQSESASLAIIATMWAFLAGIRGIVLHQIWDRENDVVSGVNTLVARLGVESARFGLLFIIFPCEILLLSLLMFVISQFAPPLGIFFILYVILRAISTKLAPPNSLDPAPLQQADIPAVAHDFYEAGKLLRSLRDKAEQWWYFLDHPQVPPDNNLAERELRLAVTKRKVSGGSRSMKRFQETADLLSVVQTCRRQQGSVLEFFQAAMIAHSHAGEFSPSLLPEPIP